MPALHTKCAHPRRTHVRLTSRLMQYQHQSRVYSDLWVFDVSNRNRNRKSYMSTGTAWVPHVRCWVLLWVWRGFPKPCRGILQLTHDVHVVYGAGYFFGVRRGHFFVFFLWSGHLICVNHVPWGVGVDEGVGGADPVPTVYVAKKEQNMVTNKERWILSSNTCN